MSSNRTIEKSIEWRKRADVSISHGALTNSKRPESHIRGVYPTHIERGKGAILWDVDGNKYVDYICGLGVNMFGYANREIDEAAMAQIKKGSIYSIGSRLEVEAAEQVKAKFPHIESLRFLKTASEACTAAVRIARAWHNKHGWNTAPKKCGIASLGYHGWHDEFVSLTEPARGVQHIYNMTSKSSTLDALVYALEYEMFSKEYTAAVIIEPTITEPLDLFLGDKLKKLIEVCKKNNVLVIFDETITALRVPRLSVARHYGIEPDLTILGKAIGGGYPLAVVGGRKDIMETDYFVSSTFAGDTVALAAMMKTLHLAKSDKYAMDRTWDMGRIFREKFNELSSLVKIKGYNTRGVFVGDDKAKALFFQEMCKAGVLFGPSWMYSHCLVEYNDQVLDLCASALKRIEHGEIKLEGQMPVVSYAQKVRNVNT